ncbi:F-box domain-containing protein [Caenorhabditis elegans]|uniref:F-box domain-containing protein n=1 Tax=Caenorhabditis elegans TaxID=6239 RepID=O17178_CAEEL|nr:F-box domain-containing protein [Caenorhabditis elegans]CCD63709.1 F-box domain-containing protein [Caenorhabditis elegans]|eukprot:NP_494079.1 F-box B protein [Caenorhabditis elegans]
MSPFHLLRLPSKELTKVLRYMVPIARFGFSLLSNKAKRLIINLQEFSHFVSIEVQNRIRLKLSRLHFIIGGPDGLVNIVYIYIHSRTVNAKWSLPGMSTRQWIDHFMELTNSHRIFKLSIDAKNPEIDMKDLHRALTGLRVSRFFLNGFYLPDIQLFGSLPTVDSMLFGLHLTQTTNYQRIMLQNHIQFTDLRRDGARADLNSLLASNASSIQFPNMILSDAQLNLFLKHWIAGSNQRLDFLKILKIRNVTVDDEEVIFKGIDRQPAVDRGDHYYLHTRGVQPKSPRKFDITSSEGVPATIYLDEPNINVFSMLVWNL